VGALGRRYDSAVSRPVFAKTRLLVSVFSPDEVAAALAGGADIVDVKNPAEGSLGAPRPKTLRRVRALVPGLLSAALGEGSPGTLALAAQGAASLGADYVKVGLLSPGEEATKVLAAVVRGAREADPKVRVIGVAFADESGAPLVSALPRIAEEAGAQGIMLDTREKSGRSTLFWLEARAIEDVFEEAHARGLETALAGGLCEDAIAAAAALPVDVLGFRGSACEGGRLGHVSAARVARLGKAIREARSPVSFLR
jgi:uncharacterized protein (UPF0264 family)